MYKNVKFFRNRSLLSSLFRSGKAGAGHGLYFAKRYKLAAMFLRSSLKGAEDWEVPMVKASLGICLFYLGEHAESRDCLEYVVEDAKANPESWDDDYSLEVLEKTSQYLEKLENLTSK